MKDPNDYIGSVFVWDTEKVKEIMQDIVNFTKQSDNNICGKRWKQQELKEITEETIAMNERLKKLEGETKSSLILSIMKCKDFHYNKWLNKLHRILILKRESYEPLDKF